MMIYQSLRFLVVGGSTFIIYFGMQYFLERSGLPAYVSLSVAYAIAISFHYVMNRTYTFRSEMTLAGTPVSLAKYASINILHYFLTLAVVGLVRSFGFDIRVGMLAAIAITTVTGFFLYRNWVFRL